MTYQKLIRQCVELARTANREGVLLARLGCPLASEKHHTRAKRYMVAAREWRELERMSRA